jgi:hypothetical protein
MITDHRWTFTIDNMNDIKQRHDNINVSEVMQYDYLYQQSMEKIEHKKKGIETCLDGRSRKKKRQKHEIGSPKTMLPRSCAGMSGDGIRPFSGAVIHKSNAPERHSRFMKSRSG